MKRIYIRVEVAEELPNKHGVYLCTLKKGKDYLVRKVFFDGDWHTSGRARQYTVANWYNSIEVPIELYQQILEQALLNNSWKV